MTLTYLIQTAKIYIEHCDATEKKAKELMKSVKSIDFRAQRRDLETIQNNNNSNSSDKSPDSSPSSKEERFLNFNNSLFFEILKNLN